MFGEREAPDTPGEATYRVSRVSITGDTLFSRQVPYDPMTTWVARDTTPSDTRCWDVFDASGKHIGALDAPADLEIHDATAERIWAVTFDEFDVPYVVRLPVRTSDQPRG